MKRKMGVERGDVIVFDREEDVRVVIPCCIKEPTPNQKLLSRVKLFSTTSDPGLHGWASYHSYGLNLGLREDVVIKSLPFMICLV